MGNSSLGFTQLKIYWILIQNSSGLHSPNKQLCLSKIFKILKLKFEFPQLPHVFKILKLLLLSSKDNEIEVVTLNLVLKGTTQGPTKVRLFIGEARLLTQKLIKQF